MADVYQKMNFSDEPWLNKIPCEWHKSRIKNIVTLSPGFSEDKPTETEEYTVVPMEAVSAYGQLNSDNFEDFVKISSGLTNFENGDVIFAKITPCMENGKGAFVNNLKTKYAFGSTEFHVLRPNHQIDGKFLYYYTFNPHFRDYAALNMTGAAGQKRVSSKFLAYTRVYLPDVLQQKIISTYLDKTCTSIDAAIETKRKQLETLDELRKSIIHKAVTRGLDDSVELKDTGVEFYGRAPRHWKKTKLRYEISIRNGDFVSDKLDEDGIYPVIGGNGLMGKTNGYNSNKEIVVIGRVGAYCGNAYYISERSWISDNALIIESTHSKKFLMYLLTAMNLNSEANKTAQPVITGTKIKNLYITLPPRSEQNLIAKQIKCKINEITKLKKNITAQITKLEQYRKSIIHECVTGKRRITKEMIEDMESNTPEKTNFVIH